LICRLLGCSGWLLEHFYEILDSLLDVIKIVHLKSLIFWSSRYCMTLDSKCKFRHRLFLVSFPNYMTFLHVIQKCLQNLLSFSVEDLDVMWVWNNMRVNKI